MRKDSLFGLSLLEEPLWSVIPQDAMLLLVVQLLSQAATNPEKHEELHSLYYCLMP